MFRKKAKLIVELQFSPSLLIMQDLKLCSFLRHNESLNLLDNLGLSHLHLKTGAISLE